MYHVISYANWQGASVSEQHVFILKCPLVATVTLISFPSVNFRELHFQGLRTVYRCKLHNIKCNI